MATGAKQIVPPAFRDQFSLGAATKVFTSDQILKNDVFSEVVKTIRSRKGKAKITILGGSHSAFSIVYLLLNGACPIPSFDDIARKQRQVRKSNSAHMVQSKQVQGDRKSGVNGVKLSLCKDCVCCPYGLTHSIHQQCMCHQTCACLSNPRIPDGANKDSSGGQGILSGDDKINILYRKQIRVHYQNVQQAKSDFYFDYDKNLDLSKGGIVYPFTGIRGDSKELWNRIKRNDIRHVELVRAETTQEQASFMQGSDIVIIACGYETNQVPILDSHGQQMALLRKSQTASDKNGSRQYQPECVDVTSNCVIKNT